MPFGGLYVTYHLLWELETPVDVTLDKTQESKAKVSILVYMWRTYFENIWTNATMNPRICQHTPGTNPRPRTNSLWRNSFHLGVWGGLGYAKQGYVGVLLEWTIKWNDHRLTIILQLTVSQSNQPLISIGPSRNDIGRASAEVETMTRSFIILWCFCEKKHSTCEKWRLRRRS